MKAHIATNTRLNLALQHRRIRLAKSAERQKAEDAWWEMDEDSDDDLDDDEDTVLRGPLTRDKVRQGLRDLYNSANASRSCEAQLERRVRRQERAAWITGVVLLGLLLSLVVKIN